MRHELLRGALAGAGQDRGRGGVRRGRFDDRTTTGLADPRAWTAADWWSDVLPHVAFGTVTALTFDLTAR